MPHRLNEHRAKVQFITAAAMPSLITRACQATDTVSNTAYIQRAVCEALSRDLGIALEDLLAMQPPHRGMAGVILGADRRPLSSGNT